MKIRGQFRIGVKKNLGEPEMELFVVIVETSQNFVPLMGRNWLDCLYPDWRNYFKINRVDNAEWFAEQKKSLIQEIINRFSSIFSKNLEEPMVGFLA